MLSRFANPHRFMNLSKWLMPIFGGFGFVMLVTGWTWGLFFAPEEQYQGATARIMFVHVPAAILSMGAYMAMAIASLLYLVLKHTLADIAAKAMAPTAAGLAFICLATGSLWGRPTWGTFWVWDARLTSMLFLLFLIVGYMALRSAFSRETEAARASAILCLVGVINLPIIKFSVDWWNTLHQPAGFLTLSGTTYAPAFYWGLWYNLIAVSFVLGALVLAGMRAEIYKRQYEAGLARLNRKGL